MTRLVFIDGKSSKFWEAEVRGSKLEVRWGRIGTAGQSKQYALKDAAAAQAEASKQIAEKRKKGYRDEAPGEPATAAPAKKKPAARAARGDEAEPLCALARVLAGEDDASLAEELRLAVADPEAYFARFAERLGGRGIDAPAETYATTLPWIALIDGLAARGHLVELDWKDEAEEVAGQLQKITKLKPKWWAWAETDEARDLPTERFLRLAAERLQEAGLKLAHVDMSADAYPLAVYPVDRHDEALKLSARCKKSGFGALAFFLGGKPKQPELPPPPPPTDTTCGLGLSSVHLAGCDAGIAVVSSSVVHASLWLDVSRWPLRVSARLPFWIDHAVRGPDGRWAVFAGEFRNRNLVKRWFRVYPEAFAEGFVDVPVEGARDGLELTTGGFANGRLLAMPGDTATFIYSDVQVAGRVYLEQDGMLRPAPGLREWRDVGQMAGLVQLGDGGSVVIWNREGHELVDGAFRSTFPGPFLVNHCPPGWTSAPAGDDGFFYISKRELYEVHRGEAPRRHLSGVDELCMVRPGPSGSLIVRRIRTGDDDPLVALLYFPASKEVIRIERQHLPGAILALESTGDGLFGLEHDEVVRVPEAVLKLERQRVK